MAQQNKSHLKTYYQTGDTPTQNEYGELIDSSLNLAETAVQTGEFSISSSGNLRLLGSSSFVGDITSSGQISASAASTVTAGTGSFSNLFEMNQNVKTTSEVTFASISFTKSSKSAVQFGTGIEINGPSFFVAIENIPAIAASADGRIYMTGHAALKLNNTSVEQNSIIIVNSRSELEGIAYNIDNGSFFMKIKNISHVAFPGGTAVFNFVVI